MVSPTSNASGKEKGGRHPRRHTRAHTSDHFVQLIDIMRNLRSKGRKRVRAAELYKSLQHFGSGDRMSRPEIKAVLEFARTSGFLIGGKGISDYVELHPDYC